MELEKEKQLLAQSKMVKAVQQEEYNLIEILKPKIYLDGIKWCILYGDNIQDGVCGFGDTAYKAILDFNQAWHKRVTISL